MTFSMTVSKTTTPHGTWNPATAPFFICLHPPFPFLALLLTHTNTLLSILPYSIKRALCRYLGVLCWSVKVTHFLVIWYNNRITALSFTWIEQHGEEGGEEGWVGLSFMRERDSGENRQQWHYLPTQTALISPHPVIKVDGYKEQLKTSRGVTVARSHLV